MTVGGCWYSFLIELSLLPVSPALDHESGIFLKTFWTSREVYSRVRPTFQILLRIITLTDGSCWYSLFVFLILLPVSPALDHESGIFLNSSGHQCGVYPGVLPTMFNSTPCSSWFLRGIVRCRAPGYEIPGSPLPVSSWFFVTSCGLEHPATNPGPVLNSGYRAVAQPPYPTF